MSSRANAKSSLACILQLAYSAIFVHRKRKGTLQRGNYTAAHSAPNDYNAYRPSQQGRYDAGPSPFRDPSPAPPYNPGAKQSHSGAAGDYYNNSYEMQQGAVRH